MQNSNLNAMTQSFSRANEPAPFVKYNIYLFTKVI